MSESVTTILVAVVGLAGTLSVAYFGYRQWQISRRDSERKDLSNARRQIYEALWKLVEKTHVEIRRDPEALRQLPERIAEVNSYILANEPYLADGDHELVNRYLEALGEMVAWVRQEGGSATQIEMEKTAPLPRGVTAVIRASALREELKARVRKALEA